jgi:hypothetical protein
MKISITVRQYFLNSKVTIWQKFEINNNLINLKLICQKNII